ncbi:MAG: hypothetical protein PHO85_03205 [Candidatus Cloacimonetes bacterium]|nr:hypothetical protein [Candidatus Cloacimonadota bacterium]MDD2507292.1 hypothetical protein [Candidatus Cloacimonadota bacterium]MDD4147509.1 hypothetical protein [Candidatus Cloacimonadota bacterium]MDD4560703.1 hypothetical protein [Candidatus Cloacimonadota bacterium]
MELSSFTVSLNPQNHVQLQWVTQSETDVMGFQIFRATVSNWEEAISVSDMISATNTSQMQSYLWVDKEKLAPIRYYYWLESVDYDGYSDFFGPVNIFLEDNIGVIPAIPPD